VTETPSFDWSRLEAIERNLVRVTAELTETRAELAKVKIERDEYRKLAMHLREENERLKRGLLGQKAERRPRDDAQLSLAIMAMAMHGPQAAGLASGQAPEDAAALGVAAPVGTDGTGGDPAGTAAGAAPAAGATDATGATDSKNAQPVSAHTRRKARREPLGEHLPRVPIEIVPPEVELEGRAAFEVIGSETREVLERRMSSTVVVQLVFKKFVRKAGVAVATGAAADVDGANTAAAPAAADAETAPAVVVAEPVGIAAAASASDAVITAVPAVAAADAPVEFEAGPAVPSLAVIQGGAAPARATSLGRIVLMGEMPELPIPRGLAGPGLLGESIVRRFLDHSPLHRLEGIYARERTPLARSTLCGWHGELAELCRCVVDAMFDDALSMSWLCTDATGVLVQAKEKCRHGHFWVLVAPERHVLYRYSPKHDNDAVDELLPGFKGYLVSDAAVVYEHLERRGVTSVFCWAHARRYAFKALATDPTRAKHMLTHIGALFQIERQSAELAPAERLAVRQAKSKPIVEAFFAWCKAEDEHVLDETPIAAAIGYALNQQAGLERFLADGALPLDNNVSERSLRRQVVGRKNWIFLGNDEGGRTNAVFVSLLASCALHDLDPSAYMRDLLCLLPRWPKSRVLDLAPVNWAKTLEQPETQQILDANVFRRVVLGVDAVPASHSSSVPRPPLAVSNG
jgi:transposase